MTKSHRQKKKRYKSHRQKKTPKSHRQKTIKNKKDKIFFLYLADVPF